MSLFNELKRRNVIRISAAYLLFAWLVTEVSSVLLPTFGAPDWVLRVVVLMLVIGFPVAASLSWIYELTPEGIKLERDVDRSQSITTETGDRLNLLTILLAASAVAFIVLDRFVLEQADLGDRPAQIAGSSPAPIDLEGKVESSGPSVHSDGGADIVDDRPLSIAVLPFVNMSSDSEQEYFSDGMTEELLNVLVKVPNILVAARTSAFSYKGQDRDVREIGRELGVQHIVEGSVRKAGDDLRITAQLIRVADGFHLWSESYDRKLENVFVIQEEIARAIAEALQAPLGLGELVPNRTADIANYTRYLEAKELLRKRGPYLEQAIGILQDLVIREPDFAPAWASLSFGLDVVQGYQDTLNGKPVAELSLMDLLTNAARRAVDLDPSLPDAQLALANALRARGQWADAEDAYRRALELNRDSIDVIEDWRQFLTEVGRVKESVAVARRGYELEPRAALAAAQYADSLFIDRRFDEAKVMAQRALDLQPDFTWPVFVLLEIELIAGNLERARELYLGCEPCRRFSWSSDVLEAMEAVRTGQAAAFDPTRLFDTQFPQLWYLVGGPDFVNASLERSGRRYQSGGLSYSFTFINNPFMDDLRAETRNQQIAEMVGLVDYWRDRGWPDYCWPTDNAGFDCGASRGQRE